MKRMVPRYNSYNKFTDIKICIEPTNEGSNDSGSVPADATAAAVSVRVIVDQ